MDTFLSGDTCSCPDKTLLHQSPKRASFMHGHSIFSVSAFERISTFVYQMWRNQNKTFLESNYGNNLILGSISLGFLNTKLIAIPLIGNSENCEHQRYFLQCYCVARKKPIRHKETKPNKNVNYSLRSWGDHQSKQKLQSPVENGEEVI